MKFLRLNYDTEAEFRKTYNVPVRSVIILFKGGRETDRLTSDGSKTSIEALVQKAL